MAISITVLISFEDLINIYSRIRQLNNNIWQKLLLNLDFDKFK